VPVASVCLVPAHLQRDGSRLRLGVASDLSQAPRPRWPLDGADMRVAVEA
jgi:hypothetical protein